MAVVPLNARPEYGLCLFSHTILISFGYSHQLCFPTSNYGWQLVTGVLWIPYVLCKTAEKRIHALHINMPKCQESPLSIKTIRNRKEKCLASSLVNVGLSEKLSVEICVSYCWVCVWGITTWCCRGLNITPSFHVVVHLAWISFEHKTEWRSRWICHLLLAFIKPPSKGIEIKPGELYWTICEPADYLWTDFSPCLCLPLNL